MNPEIWRHIFDAIDDPIFLHDAEYRLLLANRAYFQAAGIAEAKAIGRPYWEVFPPGDGSLPGCRKALEEGLASGVEEVAAADRVFQSISYPVRDEQGVLSFALHLMKDITGQRQAAQNERLHRTLLDTLTQKVFYKDRNSSYLACNAAYAADLHLSPREIVGRNDLEFYPEELARRYQADDREVMETGQAKDIEEPYVQNGEEFWVHTIKTPVRDEQGKVTGVLGIFWDVTEEKKAKGHLELLNRMYHTISLCNQALVHAGDELELAGRMCHVLVENGGFRVAWVGYAENGAEKRVRPVAAAGMEVAELEAMNISWEDNDRGRGPAGTALRTGGTAVFQDILNDLAGTPFLKLASRLGLAAAAAFPFGIDGGAQGVLAIYGAEKAAFSKDLLELLAELTGDLAFGIGNLRARAERLGILEKLEHSLDHAVAAIAATVEMRDPYTAGHQRRVARLAAEIARELRLDGDRLEGIRMAGVVHDIGKVHVPAEILTNPGKLTDAEFEIIKTHPQAGYEILKGIDFPWPVAEIVWQHHEKLDGSGYPRGLKGEELLLEARILTVADVVEAMTSHRPYRPGFGIFPSLQEISRNKGKLYDEQVVEACLRLFMQKGYEL